MIEKLVRQSYLYYNYYLKEQVILTGNTIQNRTANTMKNNW